MRGQRSTRAVPAASFQDSGTPARGRVMGFKAGSGLGGGPRSRRTATEACCRRVSGPQVRIRVSHLVRVLGPLDARF